MRTKWSRALQRFIEFFKEERTEYTDYGIRIVHTPDGFYVPMEDRKKLMDLMSKDLNAVAPLPASRQGKRTKSRPEQATPNMQQQSSD